MEIHLLSSNLAAELWSLLARSGRFTVTGVLQFSTQSRSSRKIRFKNRKVTSAGILKPFVACGWRLVLATFENLAILQYAPIDTVILVKRGRHNKEDKERESSARFKELQYPHSAVESNINMLEHHGLNRCMDKELKNYKRCVGLSVLACNLHIFGNVLKAKELIEKVKKEKRRLKLTE